MYNIYDTIAAFATPNGGAVAVLRISGALTCQILTKLTKKEFKPRMTTLATIYDGENVLDKALVTYFKAPKSYTGEDVAEISLHAGPYIKSHILELCLAIGARNARAGEFSQRAFLNGKMDLVEAQGVLDIIAAKNKAAHKAAVNSLEGRLSGKFKQIRQNLTDILAQVEVRIDDTDGEMQPLPKETKNALLNVAKEAQNLADTFSSGRLIKEGIKVALCGLTNAGKSSLLNKLLGYNRAIVSSQAGTTRDTVEAPLSLLGFDLVLVDTAGIRKTTVDEAEIEGINRSRQAIAQADITIFVRDLTLQDKNEEDKFYEEVRQNAKNLITVFNKADKTTCAEKEGLIISAKTGQGLENLEKEIIKTLNLGDISGQEIIITSAAHYKALLAAALELEKAAEKLADLELCAEHLRTALKELKELIGEVTSEDILDTIFSKFCVGK